MSLIYKILSLQFYSHDSCRILCIGHVHQCTQFIQCAVAGIPQVIGCFHTTGLNTLDIQIQLIDLLAELVDTVNVIGDLNIYL